jgi:hypothetical protein
MKKIVIALVLAPFLLLGELLYLDWVVELVRRPSDAAVFAAVFLVAVWLVIHFFLYTFIRRQLNQHSK